MSIILFNAGVVMQAIWDKIDKHVMFIIFIKHLTFNVNK